MVDYDLVLCSESARECAAVSESFHDTNEGFDVELQRAYEDLSVWITKPKDVDGDGEVMDPEGCGGTWAPYALTYLAWGT